MDAAAEGYGSKDAGDRTCVAATVGRADVRLANRGVGHACVHRWPGEGAHDRAGWVHGIGRARGAGGDGGGHRGGPGRGLQVKVMTNTTPLLQGLHVVDLASWIAGPAAATVLSDFGADVIKVEPPGAGDTYRYRSQLPESPHVAGFDYAWQLTNCNKRSIALNLKSAAARPVLERLVKWADVLVTNFPPPTRASNGDEAIEGGHWAWTSRGNVSSLTSTPFQRRSKGVPAQTDGSRRLQPSWITSLSLATPAHR